MKALRSIHVPFLFLIALVLAACATIPPADTLHKQAAVFEVSYQEVLNKAALWREEGRLSEETVHRLDQVFNRIDQAREGFYTAMAADELTKAENKLDLMRTGLTTARSILIEIERQEQ